MISIPRALRLVQKPCVAAMIAVCLLLAGVSAAQDIEILKEGVVKIKATTKDGISQVGTGFVVDLDTGVCYIATASHVVEGQIQKIEVEFFTRRNQTLPATILRREAGDPRGLAVLTVTEGRDECVTVLGLDSSLAVSGGEGVMTIGFGTPGVPWAVITGNIMGLEGRDITFSGAVDEGSSGGPLVKDGRVIGIVSQVMRNVAYAVPAVIVRTTLKGWGIEPGPPPQDGPEIESLELSPPKVRGGDSVAGRIELSRPAEEPCEVRLAVLDEAQREVVFLPEAVWIPSGHREADFGFDTAEVGHMMEVEIEGRLGESRVHAGLRLTPRFPEPMDENPLRLHFLGDEGPQEHIDLQGGWEIGMVLSLSEPATEDLRIELLVHPESEALELLQVPEFVLIPEGVREAEFHLETRPVDHPVELRIEARIHELEASASLILVPEM